MQQAAALAIVKDTKVRWVAEVDVTAARVFQEEASNLDQHLREVWVEMGAEVEGEVRAGRVGREEV
jgi:hypothetical protein